MKNITKKIISLIIIITVALSPMANVYAAEYIQEQQVDFGAPIKVISYVDEDGYHVTERTYFKADSLQRDKSGSGTFRNEKDFNWSDGSVTTYWAQGYFTWGDGDVSVSRATGGCSKLPEKCTVSNKKTEDGTGRYAGVFNKYAYVTFSCTFKNVIYETSNRSVTIRVSESGNTI